MGDQKLTDKLGNTIGYIKQEPSGKLRLTDKLGNTLGYYDPKANRTTDKVWQHRRKWKSAYHSLAVNHRECIREIQVSPNHEMRCITISQRVGNTMISDVRRMEILP